ncbi:cytochrome c biogenesis CcdA family protein [Leucobacter sp. M11]|uniref:cytochrome c biogenesis CcdA family protein n=1 Tax=Leucobacter sp. M11 TaxID=2993565 RepID=UPI002D80D348|nr:cytochrome c biogenesis CcdA family protein [Leucobacter sp. M11]MEB4615277.1 cytochrome c biogenesis CcdA family protein [Leucobacter sp. M11]
MDIGYAGALFGGLLSLLSPCSVMLLPAFFAYAFVSPAKLIARTGLFLLGLLATLVPLGIFSGTLGALVTEHRSVLVAVAASGVILMGVVQLLGIPMPSFARKGGADPDATSAVSVFLLGAVYAVAGVCTGPILGSVLMMAALGGSPAYGAILLALYAVGMALPLFALAAVWRKMGDRGRAWLRPKTLSIGRWQNSWIMIISGTLSIGVGLLLLLTDGTAGIGSLIPIGAQYRAESWVSVTGSQIPNAVFLIGAIVLAGLVFAAVKLRGARTARKTAAPTAETEPAEERV